MPTPVETTLGSLPNSGGTIYGVSPVPTQTGGNLIVNNFSNFYNYLANSSNAASRLATDFDSAGSANTVQNNLNTHTSDQAAHQAVSTNTSGRIVLRDGSGNFSAGTITASVTGHSSLDLPLAGGTLTGPVIAGNYTDTSSSGTARPVQITTTYNQTSTAGSSDLYINRTQTAVGSGAQLFVNCAVSGSSVFSIDNLGNVNSIAAVSAALMNGASFRTGTTNQPTDFANRAFTTSGTIARVANATQAASSGNLIALAVTPTWNNSSTAASIDFLINRTETALGGSGNWYILCQTAGTTNFSVTNIGTVTSNNYYSLANDSTLGLQGRTFTGGNAGVAAATGTFSGGTGIQQIAFKVAPTYNQTSTAAATDLLINRTQTAVGSGSQLFLDCQVAGSSKASIDNAGNVTTTGTVTATSFAGQGIVPVGTVTAWLKSYTGTPALPTGWVECNGQTLSDAASVYNGAVIPNLNNSGGTAAQRFLRGSTTSGSVGGADSHTHAICQASICTGTSASTTVDVAATTSSSSSLPSYYEVVYIIRVK